MASAADWAHHLATDFPPLVGSWLLGTDVDARGAAADHGDDGRPLASAGDQELAAASPSALAASAVLSFKVVATIGQTTDQSKPRPGGGGGGGGGIGGGGGSGSGCPGVDAGAGVAGVGVGRDSPHPRAPRRPGPRARPAHLSGSDGLYVPHFSVAGVTGGWVVLSDHAASMMGGGWIFSPADEGPGGSTTLLRMAGGTWRPASQPGGGESSPSEVGRSGGSGGSRGVSGGRSGEGGGGGCDGGGGEDGALRRRRSRRPPPVRVSPALSGRFIVDEATQTLMVATVVISDGRPATAAYVGCRVVCEVRRRPQAGTQERRLVMLDAAGTRTMHMVAFEERLVDGGVEGEVGTRPGRRPLGATVGGASTLSDVSSCTSASADDEPFAMDMSPTPLHGGGGNRHRGISPDNAASLTSVVRAPVAPPPHPRPPMTSVTDFSGLPAVLTAFFCGTFGASRALTPGASCLSAGYHYIASPLLSAASQAPLRASLWRQLHLSPGGPLGEGGGWLSWPGGGGGGSGGAGGGWGASTATGAQRLLLGAPGAGSDSAARAVAAAAAAADAADEERKLRNRAAATRANERRKWLTARLALTAPRVTELRARHAAAAAENGALRRRAAAAGLRLPPPVPGPTVGGGG